MRPKTWSPLLVLALALSCLVAVAAAVQARPKIPPPDFVREVEEDAAGMQQWKAFDVECPHCKGAKSHICENCDQNKRDVCLECDGSKRATCRICGGKGKVPDPLVELACPYCWGSSWYACGLCNGFGKIGVDGKDTVCGACKQKGLLPCTGCGGKRRVDTVRIGKKTVGEVGAKDLVELQEKLKACLTALEGYEPDENPSRATKEFVKTIEPLKKDLKATKDMQVLLEEVLKGIKNWGAGYTGNEARLAHQFLVFRDRTVFLLQHQIRATEQALARAQSNESKSVK
jgi:hypothetical protein